MFDPSVGPPIPQRTSARTNPKSIPGRRRRSVPAASSRDVKRQTSNHVVVKPASTEVIMSMIETLSAIASPAEHHFDFLPSIASSQSTPSSPRPWQFESPLTTGPTSCAPQGDSMRPTPRLATDLDARKKSYGVHDTYFLHPNRSAIKGWSPTRISSDESSLEDANKPTEVFDFKGGDHSTGDICIEPKASITSSSSNKSDEQRSLNSFTSLRLSLKASRDSFHESSGLIISKTASQEWSIGRRTTPGSPGPETLMVSKRGTRNSVASEPPNIPTRASSVQSNGSLGRRYRNLEETYEEPRSTKKKYSIPNEDYIPTRNSSIRHIQRLSPSRHERRSQLSESSSGIDPNMSSSTNQPDSSEQALQGVPGEPREDSVNRRIKELRDQKLERERSSMETSTEFFSAPQTPDRSPAPSPGPVAPQPNPVCPLVPKEKTGAVEVQHVELWEDTGKSAPAPTIPQRVNKSNGVRASSVEAELASEPDPSTITADGPQVSSLALPKRSNSRLLKRFSRSISPAPAEERKKVSNNLLESKRTTSYQIQEADPISDAVDEYLLSSRLSQKISDPQTGRVISFSEVGDPEGSVVFCCVGMGLTRFITAFYDELASTLKLRLVTPDRPGVGGSEPHPDGLDTPLGWPDDVRAICQHLNITKFSILAHSAGAIYALATALRMPQHIRCRVHLLAPWIPPSQMFTIGAQQELSPARSLPYSQRLLRSLPTTFLKAANSSFLSVTSASVTTSLPKSPLRSKRKSFLWSGSAIPDIQEPAIDADRNASLPPKLHDSAMADFPKETQPPSRRVSTPTNAKSTAQSDKERRPAYEARLTEAIWDAATTRSNPAVDLMVCLERRQPIGFRYVDITRSVVIHHGSKDSRVPVENVKWLSETMRRCEVRVIEGEGHGLMASASVMGTVLMEMAQEWSDWNRVVKGRGGMGTRVTNAV